MTRQTQEGIGGRGSGRGGYGRGGAARGGGSGGGGGLYFFVHILFISVSFACLAVYLR